MAHLKRLNVPTGWPVARKQKKFTVTPMPGPHPKMGCLPLALVVRDVLGLAKTSREARSILNRGMITVDKKPRKEPGFPVGLMDVVEIPETKHSYRVVMSGSGLRLEKIGHDETSIKTCKVTGKTTLRGGLMQINLHDGRNILAKKDTFKIGDSVVISLPDQAITSHMKLEKGAEAFITTGRNRGVWGKIKEIKERQHMLEKPVVTLDTGKKEIITPKGYIFIASREARASKETGSDKK